MCLHSTVRGLPQTVTETPMSPVFPVLFMDRAMFFEAFLGLEPLGAFTYQSDSKCVHDANVVSAGRMGTNHDLAKRSGLLMLAWELNMFLICLSISLTPVVGQHFSRVTRTYANVTDPRKRAYIPHATQA